MSWVTGIPDEWWDQFSQDALTMSERIVFIILARYAKRSGEGARPALSTVAARAGASLDTARRAVQGLKTKGWIIMEEVPGRPSNYTLMKGYPLPTPSKMRGVERAEHGTPLANTGGGDSQIARGPLAGCDPIINPGSLTKNNPRGCGGKPADLSFQKNQEELLNRYDGSRSVIESTLAAIPARRGPGERVRFLQRLDTFPAEHVVGGCGDYLQQDHAKIHSPEKYLLRMIANRATAAKQQAATNPSARKRRNLR